MSNIFITLDYELFFGSNSGTQEKSIINPTNRLLEVLDKFQIKATFFVDSGYLIKLDDYRKKYSILENDYKTILEQIMRLDRDGHDIQLHIHPHWEDSYFNGKKWIIDTSRYKLDDFSSEKIDDIVYRYKKVLTDIVGEKVFVYRAGGWCMQPFSTIKDALKKNNIWLDSTVFRGGKNSSKTHTFDFTNAPNKRYWRFDDNPLVENKDGFFTEIPIADYKISPLFYWKFAFFKKFGGENFSGFGDGVAATSTSKWDKVKMLITFSQGVVSLDGYRIAYLEKAFKLFKQQNKEKNFVIIGHPKAMNFFSLNKLDSFIRKNNNENYTIYSKEFNHE